MKQKSSHRSSISDIGLITITRIRTPKNICWYWVHDTLHSLPLISRFLILFIYLFCSTYGIQHDEKVLLFLAIHLKVLCYFHFILFFSNSFNRQGDVLHWRSCTCTFVNPKIISRAVVYYEQVDTTVDVNSIPRACITRGWWRIFDVIGRLMLKQRWLFLHMKAAWPSCEQIWKLLTSFFSFNQKYR